MLHSRRTPEYKCPYCDRAMNRVGAIAGQIPPTIPAGAFFVCAACFEIGVFESDQTVRKALPIELEEMKKIPAIREQLDEMHRFAAWLKAQKSAQNN